MTDEIDVNSIYHRPWRGSLYEDGIEGRRIMIVGNSHWLGEDGTDGDFVTEEVLGNVVSGHYNIAFFNQIRDYFGYANHVDFWSRVTFLNYAPWAIGKGEKRFGHLSGEMVPPAKSRFVREISKHSPDIVLVFSKKIRWALPDLTFQNVELPLSGARLGMLPSTKSPRIFLLRHTQGAPKHKMIETVAAALNMP